MEIIKEFYSASAEKICTIRTNTYGRDFAFIKSLVDEGKRDFQNLKDEEINIVLFGGERYDHTSGIRFIISTDIVPEGYDQRNYLEQIY